jgi:hypothetical protein
MGVRKDIPRGDQGRQGEESIPDMVQSDQYDASVIRPPPEWWADTPRNCALEKIAEKVDRLDQGAQTGIPERVRTAQVNFLSEFYGYTILVELFANLKTESGQCSTTPSKSS